MLRSYVFHIGYVQSQPYVYNVMPKNLNAKKIKKCIKYIMVTLR
jgi:hypothetical protein